MEICFWKIYMIVKESFYIVDVDVVKCVLSHTVSNYKMGVNLFVY